MLSQKTKTLRFAASIAIVAAYAVGFLAASPSHATIVFSDGFGDGNRDQGSLADTGPEGPLEDAGDIGGMWVFTSGFNSFVVSIADDTAGIGSGNALTASMANKDTRALASQMASQTLASVGDGLALSFDLRLPSLAPLETGFRFGLYNSNGTWPVEDEGTGTSAADDLGYNAALTFGPPELDAVTAKIVADRGAIVVVGSKNKSGIFRDENADDFGATTTDLAGAINDMVSHQVVFTVSRAADDAATVDPTDLLITVDVDGNQILSRKISEGGLDPLATSFDAIYFGTINADRNLATELLIDNIHVDTVVVPTAIVGDLDGDGFVGITDLNLVLSNWNENPPDVAAADPSGDGFVGIEDLNVVLGNWNAGIPPAVAVPEPAGLTLLSLGGLAMLNRRR